MHSTASVWSILSVSFHGNLPVFPRVFLQVPNLGALANPDSLKLFQNIPETQQWWRSDVRRGPSDSGGGGGVRSISAATVVMLHQPENIAAAVKSRTKRNNLEY